MNIFKSQVVAIGLAIFAMLFGAGNLIFPIKVGIICGNKTALGLFAFLLTGVFIPLAGLIGIVLFDGNYQNFFDRLGKPTSTIFIFLCMLIIGPLLVMPRIIDFSYELIKPFVGNYIGILSFSLTFCAITFVCCYRKNSLIDLIGKFLSPMKLLLLSGIVIYGFLTGVSAKIVNETNFNVFFNNLLLGYNTLDLLGSIFFGYIILSILKANNQNNELSKKDMESITFKGSLIGGALLTLVYIGMAYTGTLHGQGLESLNAGKMFIHTMLRLLSSKGAILITSTVLLACLTTIIALTSVVSEYLSKNVLSGYISYVPALGIILLVTTLLAQLELEKLMEYSEPLIFIFYPAIITLTFCNIAYKLWNFKPVKIPVFLTLFISGYFYFPKFISQFTQKPITVEKAFDFESPIQQ